MESGQSTACEPLLGRNVLPPESALKMAAVLLDDSLLLK